MAKKNENTGDELEKLTGTEHFFDKNKKFLIIGGVSLVVIVVGFISYQKVVTEPFVEESHDAYWNAFYEWQYNDTTELAYDGNDLFMGMDEISSEYEGTAAGEIGSYAMATHAMEKGEWDNALSYLEDCEFTDVMVGSLVIGMMGDCYVELQDYETAAQKFEEAAAREENEFTSPMFLKKAGLVYEELEDYASAVAVYQKIKDNWPAATEADGIEKYIARIEEL